MAKNKKGTSKNSANEPDESQTISNTYNGGNDIVDSSEFSNDPIVKLSKCEEDIVLATREYLKSKRKLLLLNKNLLDIYKTI